MKIIKNIVIYFTLLVSYILMPIFIYLDIIKFEYKFYLLVIISICVYFILKVIGFKNKELGLSLKNTKKSIKDIMLLTCVMSLICVILYLLNFSRFKSTEGLCFYIFYIFFSCPTQEFLYRGSLNAMLKYIKVPTNYILVITTFLYSFVHIIYNDILTLIFTFLIGIYWFKKYIKTENIIGVTISHIVLGITTIMLGIIN